MCEKEHGPGRSLLPAGHVLRAAVALGLSDLEQQQGKGQEPHALLAPFYGSFTGGLDIADVREAKALLEALAG